MIDKQSVTIDVESSVHLEEELVMSMREGGITVADVYSDVWGPCKAIAPTFRRLLLDADESVNLKFLTVNSNKVLAELKEPTQNRRPRNFPALKKVEQPRDTAAPFWKQYLQQMEDRSKPIFLIWHDGRLVHCIEGVNTPDIATAITDLTTVQKPASDFIFNPQLLEQWWECFGPNFSQIRWPKFLEGVGILCKLTVPLTVEEEAALIATLNVRADRVVHAEQVQQWVGSTGTLLQAFTSLLPEYEERAIQARMQQEEEERKRLVGALVQACEWGELSNVQHLVDRKADVNGRINKMKPEGAVGEVLFGQITPLMAAAAGPHAALVGFLIDKQADVQAVNDSDDGRTVLHYASSSDIATILLQHGADTAQKGHGGSTALHSHARVGRVGVIQQLLTFKADPNATTSLGYTPLHMAVAGKSGLGSAKLLLENGASVNSKGQQDVGHASQTPLHSCCDANPLSTEQYLILSLLLQQSGIEVDALGSDGSIALHKAARRNRVDLLEMLVRHGAEKRAKNSDGVEPRDLTNHPGIRRILQPEWHEEFIDCIRRHEMFGFEMVLQRKDIDLNYQDWTGTTPLMFACLYGNATVVREFVKRGARRELQQRTTGATATLFAQWGGHPDVISQGFEQVTHTADKDGLERLKRAKSRATEEEARFLQWGAGMGTLGSVKRDPKYARQRLVRTEKELEIGLKIRMESGAESVLEEAEQCLTVPPTAVEGSGGIIEGFLAAVEIPGMEGLMLDAKHGVLQAIIEGCELSVAELVALYSYSYESELFDRVDAALLSQTESKVQPYKPFIAMLQRALSDLPPVRDRWVYRGVSTGTPLARYKPGAILQWPGFTTGTRSLGHALHPLQFPTSGTTVLFRIRPKLAVDVSPFSHFPAEQAVLFPPGARFAVIGISVPGESWLSVAESGGDLSKQRGVPTVDELEGEPQAIIELEEL